MGNEIITTAQMYWLTRLTPLGHAVGFIIFTLAVLTFGLLLSGLMMQEPGTFEDETHTRMEREGEHVAVLRGVYGGQDAQMPLQVQAAQLRQAPPETRA